MPAARETRCAAAPRSTAARCRQTTTTSSARRARASARVGAGASLGAAQRSGIRCLQGDAAVARHRPHRAPARAAGQPAGLCTAAGLCIARLGLPRHSRCALQGGDQRLGWCKPSPGGAIPPRVATNACEKTHCRQQNHLNDTIERRNPPSAGRGRRAQAFAAPERSSFHEEGCCVPCAWGVIEWQHQVRAQTVRHMWHVRFYHLREVAPPPLSRQ